MYYLISVFLCRMKDGATPASLFHVTHAAVFFPKTHIFTYRRSCGVSAGVLTVPLSD